MPKKSVPTTDLANFNLTDNSPFGFHNPKRRNTALKIILLLVILYFSSIYINDPDKWIFLDYANLGIHEGGHLIFGGFGLVIGFLGGTIFQLIVPLLFTVYFIVKKSAVSIGFCLFWLGVNFKNVGWYIKDARDMAIPTLGEGIHDWNWLLTRWNLLEKDILIGSWVQYIGFALIALSAGYLIVSLGVDLKKYILRIKRK